MTTFSFNPFASLWAPSANGDNSKTPHGSSEEIDKKVSTGKRLPRSFLTLQISSKNGTTSVKAQGSSPCAEASDLNKRPGNARMVDADDVPSGGSLSGDSLTPFDTLSSDDIAQDLSILLDETTNQQGGGNSYPHEMAQEMENDGPVQPLHAAMGSTRVEPQDFSMLRVVGKGAFGKVFQVRHKATNKIYAMKVMRKEHILEREHAEYVRSEQDLLTSVTHPYIVQLRFSFQTPGKLYLVLDFINGGHLFFNLYRQGVFSEDVARLYTAEIVSALAYLHSRGIMHRDLKPENVLLDNEGHIRLTDFGLAKGNMGDDINRTNSFIGTMEYMAPEIIDGKGHSKGVDWWSTGILLYEMLCGVPPFRAKSRNALQQQIVQAKAKYPKFLSSDALSLLKGLLTRDPTKRLGSGSNGSEAIKRHPFFKSINWAKLERREIESKFKPSVTGNSCVENFDKIWTDQLPEDSPCGTPTTGHDSAFHGFTYVEPSYLEHVMESRGKAHAASKAPHMDSILEGA
mmetsp:Transcript_22199/g.48473  ORF Transcript_22199/g.48473 Transcript_22199/m.48473 type:complete len:514 (+) Transcript_22199:245-1786(+)